MLSPTPAVRAALVGTVLVVALAMGAAALHLDRLRDAAATASLAEVDAAAAATAAALRVAIGPEEDVVRAFDRLPASPAGPGLVLLDARGRVLLAADSARTQGVRWDRALRTGGAALQDERANDPRALAPMAVAVAPLERGGFHVGAARAARPAMTTGETWATAASVFLAMALLAGLLGVVAWYGGPRTAALVGGLAERMASREGDPHAQIERSAPGLGAFATGLTPLAKRVLAGRAETREVRAQVAALFQVNPHYIVLATLDGQLVEANPAFYAVTGLPFEAIRGGRIESLREVFPVEPLLELAERSHREGSSIQGIEYALVNDADETLPVQVSLRGVTVQGQRAVLIQATDVSARERLQRQVSAFSDTLDLMVDQRVAELTAGRTTLRHLLDRGGVVVASFDGSGATVRWNGAAEALTGHTAATAPHFTQAVAALGLAPADATVFTAWFWSGSPEPYVADSAFSVYGGLTVQRRMVWRVVESAEPGRADRRTLLGLEIPDVLPPPGESTRFSAAPAIPDPAAGDGYGGYAAPDVADPGLEGPGLEDAVPQTASPDEFLGGPSGFDAALGDGADLDASEFGAFAGMDGHDDDMPVGWFDAEELPPLEPLGAPPEPLADDAAGGFAVQGAPEPPAAVAFEMPDPAPYDEGAAVAPGDEPVAAPLEPAPLEPAPLEPAPGPLADGPAGPALRQDASTLDPEGLVDALVADGPLDAAPLGAAPPEPADTPFVPDAADAPPPDDDAVADVVSGHLRSVRDDAPELPVPVAPETAEPETAELGAPADAVDAELAEIEADIQALEADALHMRFGRRSTDAPGADPAGDAPDEAAAPPVREPIQISPEDLLGLSDPDT